MSFRSPKNKYRIELTYGKAISEIGSVSSYTANETSETHNVLLHHIEQAKKNNTTLTVVWKENKKVYPEFDWVEVKKETY